MLSCSLAGTPLILVSGAAHRQILITVLFGQFTDHGHVPEVTVNGQGQAAGRAEAVSDAHKHLGSVSMSFRAIVVIVDDFDLLCLRPVEHLPEAVRLRRLHDGGLRRRLRPRPLYQLHTFHLSRLRRILHSEVILLSRLLFNGNVAVLAVAHSVMVVALRLWADHLRGRLHGRLQRLQVLLGPREGLRAFPALVAALGLLLDQLVLLIDVVGANLFHRGDERFLPWLVREGPNLHPVVFRPLLISKTQIILLCYFIYSIITG